MPVLIFCLGFCFIFYTLFLTNKNYSKLSSKDLFFSGLFLGLLTNFLQIFFPNFLIKSIITIILLVCRYSFIVPDNVFQVILCSVVDVLILVILCCHERNLLKFLNIFSSSKDQLSKFENLLAIHLPENIVILNKDLTKKFFITNSFVNNFGAEDLRDIKIVLSHLKMNLNTFEQDSIRNTGVFSSFNPNVSLVDFMSHCKNDIMQYNQVVCFNVENEDPLQNKITYEAKILHIKWDDENDAIIIILSDLSQQETILALKRANENKDNILATVSHELRTPINGILGITQIMEHEYEDQQLLSYCSTVKICSKMLLNLVNSILDLTQIRNNCITLHSISFRIIDMIEEIKSVFQSQCDNKGILLQVEIDEEAPKRIFSDYHRLMQVLFNLLANALKFTFHGKIVIKVEKTQNERDIKFSIEDTGIGIKEEDKPKLFKMFGRIEQAHAKINTQGVGLGLTISNSLVKLLNGGNNDAHIEFASEYGKGSAFFFTVSTRLAEDLSISIFSDHNEEKRQGEIRPKKKSDCYGDSMAEENLTGGQIFPSGIGSSVNTLFPLVPYPKVFSPKEQDRPFKSLAFSSPMSFEEKSLCDLFEQINPKERLKVSPKKEYALVVDDNPFNVLIASKILEKYGFTVISAFNGKDAIAKVKEQKKSSSFFKMVMMDCEMPIMNGYEATEILKKMMNRKEIPELPIIALTANDTKKDKEKCLKVGMLGHLTKPLKEEEFVKIMNKCKYLQN